MILILTNSLDEHADLVQQQLSAMSVKFMRLDVDRWRTQFRITFDPSRASLTLEEAASGKTYDAEEITAVWYRRPHDPSLPVPNPSPTERFVEGEWRYALQSLYTLLRDRFWLSDLNTLRLADSKPYQLQLARTRGFRIPRTLISNDPAKAIHFAQSIEGELAYKPLHSFAQASDDGSDVLTVFTNVVSKDLAAKAAQIERAPCIFQEYIPKKLELRVTVVGRNAFCAAIHSQQSQVSAIDWRKYDLANTPYEPFELGQTTTDQILRLMSALGLHFGCLDFIVTPKDELIFLEINPNGQWFWIEKLTGLPIARNLAALLAESAAYPAKLAA